MSELNAMAFPFSIDRSAGRIREERDYEAYIVQLIRQTLLTGLGERINRPDFGANVRQMVFGPNNAAAATYGRTLVYQALTRWLSNFIRTETVDVRAEESTLWINVEYTVIAKGEKRFLNVELSL
jgi:hypothetical protein